MVKKRNKSRQIRLEQLSLQLTSWVGTPTSILIHTFAFLSIFSLAFFGISIDQILLILTTAVSLEAIYLAIFIQMTVNRNTKSLQAVEADIDDIQEGVEDLEGEVEELSADLDEIQSDEDQTENRDVQALDSLESIQKQLNQIVKDLQAIKAAKTKANE